MSYLGLPLQECLPDLAYAHQPGFASSFILEGNSQKLLRERKVRVFKWWCLNVLLAGHIQRQGVGLSVLARLFPAWHNQHMCTWRQGSALLCLGQHVFGSKVDTGVLWGSNEVTLLRTLFVSLHNVLYVRPPSHCFVFSHGSYNWSVSPLCTGC